VNIKLTSYGAAEQVTGSCHLLNINGYRILIDCGMFQGSWENYLKNWDDFLFDAKDLDAVILTHAHLDHCGRLPKLVKAGYKGKIYATDATIDLTKIVLDDSFYIMNEKAFKKKLPKLNSLEDLNKTYKNFVPIKYDQKTKLSENISFKLHNAAHILGSAFVEIQAGHQTIVFSGDIGGQNMPLVKDIDTIQGADYVICESTYGDRVHEDTKTRDKKLLEAVKRVTINHSTLLIAIFALERTQDILKVLNDYYEKHLDFTVPVYLDSPMAAQATQIYQKHLEYLNKAAQDDLSHDNNIFNFPHLKITNNIRQSKQINLASPPKIILAGSGMMEGGRMIHHLARYAPETKNTMLFMGFQVPGTLGHKILQGTFDFDYYGQKIPIKCQTDQIDGFSAHADQKSLIKWLSNFNLPTGKAGKTKKIILSHGDKTVMEHFAKEIQDKLQLKTEIIKNNSPIELL